MANSSNNRGPFTSLSGEQGDIQPSVTGIDDATEHASRLRDEVGMIGLDAKGIYQDALRLQLDTRAAHNAKRGLKSLLFELNDARGLGWSELSRLLGVSVPAIRKWRLGGRISPDRLLALARLAGFLDALEEQSVSDPAAWLHLPLSTELDRGISGARLYAEGLDVDLLEYANGHLTLSQLLNSAGKRIPLTRRTHDVLLAPDGHYSVIPSERAEYEETPTREQSAQSTADELQSPKDNS
jgi:hypothetical protein